MDSVNLFSGLVNLIIPVKPFQGDRNIDVFEDNVSLNV